MNINIKDAADADATRSASNRKQANGRMNIIVKHRHGRETLIRRRDNDGEDIAIGFRIALCAPCTYCGCFDHVAYAPEWRALVGWRVGGNDECEFEPASRGRRLIGQPREDARPSKFMTHP